MKRLLIVSFFSTVPFLACTSTSPFAIPAPTQNEPASVTATILPNPLPLCTPTVIPSAMPDVLYVNPSRSRGTINPLSFGSNYGQWVAVSVDMLPAAYDSSVTLLRFPASSWGDQRNAATYQICHFMAFASNVGVNTMFNV